MWGGRGPDAEIRAYAERLSRALERCSYEEAGGVTSMLSIRYRPGESGHAPPPTETPDTRVLEVALESPWDAVLGLHLRVTWLISRRRLEDAFGVQAQLIALIVREVIAKLKDENWFLPIVYQLCADLRLLAKAADAAGSHEGERSFLEQSASSIMDCYRACVNDIRASMEVTKRLAILNLTNQLFRIYFRINKLNLLKPLIRAVENCGDLYRHFSMADKVTYKYYLGRKAMFDADLATAEAALSFAFRQTKALGHARNEHLILSYLVPVKMFLGHMPREELLRRYRLAQFIPVAEAVKEGNLKRLDEALEEHQAFFIKSGIFLMLEKLKMITYRNLFKRVASLAETHQIDLSTFVAALRFAGSPEEGGEADESEVACILANLIFEGKIKGYISHQHKKLVVSKQTPFPKLGTIA